MVSIRLARHGAKKAPVYRMVATDSRAPRDGRFIEVLGTHKPSGNDAGTRLKLERIDYWISKGARPSDTARRLIKEVRKAEAAAAAE
ncbi:MAG: 30S ribosomal protein S16 [Deltaproteobacteria bacterium]|nr:30S ribosomal protein S16 [Deltaproteobacteria bacterium]